MLKCCTLQIMLIAVKSDYQCISVDDRALLTILRLLRKPSNCSAQQATEPSLKKKKIGATVVP